MDELTLTHFLLLHRCSWERCFLSTCFEANEAKRATGFRNLGAWESGSLFFGSSGIRVTFYAHTLFAVAAAKVRDAKCQFSTEICPRVGSRGRGRYHFLQEQRPPSPYSADSAARPMLWEGRTNSAS